MSGRDLHPTDGARFLLERDAAMPHADAARVTYRVSIFTPTETFAARAELGDDGSATLAATGAPAELDAAALMFARLVARGAAKKRTDGMPPWPARVLRWRGPGRGG